MTGWTSVVPYVATRLAGMYGTVREETWDEVYVPPRDPVIVLAFVPDVAVRLVWDGLFVTVPLGGIDSSEDLVRELRPLA